MNVDAQEINKFAQLASRWWDKNSEFKALHDINPLRHDYINSHSGGLSGKTVLDVGCGGGILSESMSHSGAMVKGIDLGQAGLEVAKLHSIESGVKVDYEQISAEELALREPQKYEVVTCLEMLEHVPEPAAIIKACYDLVKPNGQVFFSTLNRNPKAYLFAIIGAEYLLNLLPKGTHDYNKFITPYELDTYARHAGLTLKDTIGMSYNPLTKQYKLGDDVSVNYLCHYTKGLSVK